MRQFTVALTIVSLFVLSNGVFAQKALYKKAAQEMETLQYEAAIATYEKILRKQPEQLDALLGMAEAQRKAGQLADAVTWYRQITEMPDAPAIAYYRYGQLLLFMGDCLTAQSAFDTFLLRKPYYTQKADLEDVCAWIESIEHPDFPYVLSLPDFNGKESDLSPAFYQDGLVFGAVKKDGASKQPYYGLYFTKPTTVDQLQGLSITYEPTQPFSEVFNAAMNAAIITFSADGQEAYYTSNQTQTASDQELIHRLEILVSRLQKDSSWSAPKALPFNSSHYSTAHPALSPDGNRLFFASDRPGGFGGKDLYVVNRNADGTWSVPVNLGPSINTEGDELFPFYHQDGILFFASNGQLGLGGLDIFQAEDMGEGTWSTVKNMGSPINSKADDFSLVMHSDGTYGFLTSNREGGAGSDDIYAFQTGKIPLDLAFFQEDHEDWKGQVTFKVRGMDTLFQTDTIGKWTTWLNKDECIYVQVIDEGVMADEFEICANAHPQDRKQPIALAVQPKPISDELVAKGDGTIAHVAGYVLDEDTEAPIEGALVYMLSSDCATTIRTPTDSTGRFQFKPQPGCCYTVKVTSEGYFANSYRATLCTNKISAEEPVRYYLASHNPAPVKPTPEEASVTAFQPSDSKYKEAGMSAPYLLNVYYDTGRSSVRAEAIPELNRLYWLLVFNPDISVEISSHTDARGNAEFNQRLSQRRANAIVTWLIKKGIGTNRLSAKGYGEERLVNGCTDEVSCSEEEHQMNRRTEFRIIQPQLGQAQ
ncbi:MAG: OmpA family protein [Saprospiraceae bacterium]